MEVLTALFRPGSRGFTVGVLGAAAALALSGCSKKTTTTGSSSSPTSSDAAITVMTANVSGVGTVLVNGDGLTLYHLSSEQGGTITCTDANGCTKVWPDTELPKGKTAGIAGTGVQASLLGTAKSSSGDLYLTYSTFPLYTFTGDHGPGTAAGQGITSFGGTWSAIKADGTSATAGGAAPTSTASASAAATVQTGQATVGTTHEAVLTDANGKTLYYRTSDTATTASCSGGCANVWPPLMATGSPTGGAGVTGKLTAVSGANGSQVQYNGHFLYRYASDTAAGSAKGDGVAGVWHVATPTLAVMGAAPAAPAPAATIPAATTPAPAASTPAPAPSSSNPYGY